MNRSYRLVWSVRNNAFVPVAENMPARGKRSRSGAKLTAAVGFAGLALGAVNAFGQQAPPTPAPTALPTGGQVVSGQSTITQRGSTLNITQTSQQSIINWQSFNVGSQAQVNFQQNNSGSVSLDRVVGGNLSQIEGRINANGQVYLVNPNGVIFGKGSEVNVGGLVASTLDISNADFNKGNLTFNRNGATGTIVNDGTITVTAHGTAALLSPNITNTGIVTAQLGRVVMAAGDAVTMSFNRGVVGVQVDPATVAALIDNQQLIEAAGGQVIMTARAANTLLGAAINNTGTVSASSLVAEGGTVKLVASTISNTGSIAADGATGGTVNVQAAGEFDEFGTVSVKGTLGAGGTIDANAQRSVMVASATMDADGATDGGTVDVTLGTTGNGGGYYSGTLSASGAAGKGGTVEVTGLTLDLFGTQVDAHGTTGGGTALIGGDEHGANASVFNADSTMVNAVNIDVSATESGGGGKAVVWSQSTTGFDGSIDARGAANGVKSTATGGTVEISSKNSLYFDGTVQAKNLLLDPAVISIINPGLGLSLTAFIDPDNAASGFGAQVYDLTNNNNLLVLSPNESLVGSGAGYVFERNGTLVSALRDTGATANWTSLGNDRFLITNQGADGGVGAVAYFNGDSPPASGQMNTTNSLIGNDLYASGGGYGVLSNLGGGYWATSMNSTGQGTAGYGVQRGAWTFFQAGPNGTNLPTGTVGPTNSLVGSTAGVPGSATGNTWVPNSYGDALGYWVEGSIQQFNNSPTPQIVISALVPDGNGTWLLGSGRWTDTTHGYQYAGAVTFISPTLINSGALVGAVGPSNSVVGTAVNQQISIALRVAGAPGGGALTNFGNGDYVLNLNNVGLMGITPSTASAGVTGAVSPTNALVLTNAGDIPGLVEPLSNGAVVLANSSWNGGEGYEHVLQPGANFAATFIGTLPAISSSNSLVGTTSDNFSGFGGSHVGERVTDLGNGDFLVYSGNEGSYNYGGFNPAQGNLGAYTWSTSTSPVTGSLSTTNSLMGTANYVVSSVQVLAGGAYVVQGGANGPNSSGNAADSDLAYGSATAGVHGSIESVGLLSGIGTYINLNNSSVEDLGGGYWATSYTDGGSNIGLVWGGPTVSRTGVVSGSNSLLGGIAPFALGTSSSPSTKFVAAIPSANGGTGALMLLDASSATIPTVINASTALVGGSASDAIGSGGFVSLGNGSAVYMSPGWNGNEGAATLVNAANASTRLLGTVSSSNSLVGSSANDQVSSDGVVPVSTSGYWAVVSTHWNGEEGAVTIFNGSGDVTGVVSSANSLVGSTAGDNIGNGTYAQGSQYINASSPDLFFSLGNGEYAMRSANYKANPNDTSAAGALTWISFGNGIPTGVVGPGNSLVGAFAGDQLGDDAALAVPITGNYGNLTGYDHTTNPLFQPLGNGYYALRDVDYNGGLGSLTVFNSAAPPVGTVSATNSIINAGSSTGVMQLPSGSSEPTGGTLTQLGSNGWVLLTPTWNGGEGAVTYIAPNSIPVGDISSSISLVGTANQAFGGNIVQLSNGALVIGSPGWQGGRGASTWLSTSANGLAATLTGTITLDATNSFVGTTPDSNVNGNFVAGDEVASGGVVSLSNDVFLVSSPHFGVASNPSTINGAVTLGDSVTNGLVGDVSVVNSFFGSPGSPTGLPYVSPQGVAGVIISTGNQVEEVEVTQPVQLVGGNLAYSDYAGRNVTMLPSTLTAVLDTGTAVTLQATNAINVFSPIVVNNPNGAGGNLTLEAGMSPWGNTAPGTVGTVTIGTNGSITTGNGNLLVVSDVFVNNALSPPFHAGTGTWMVYADDPTTSQPGNNLGFDYKQYGLSYVQEQANPSLLQGTGNGLIFAASETLNVQVNGDNRQYDGTNNAGPNAIVISGLVEGDTIPMTVTDSSIHVSTCSPCDLILDVTGTGVTSSVATGSKPVYGYLNQPAVGTTTYTGMATITPLNYQVDLNPNATVTKVYDGTYGVPSNIVLPYLRASTYGNPTVLPDQIRVVPDTANGAVAKFVDSAYGTYGGNPASTPATATQVQVYGRMALR
jgi:filamentous hemagglutinin family protein